MTFRNLMLSGASALVLTFGAAMAQGDDPYTHNPTPQERAQTQSLNTQQANDAQATSEEAATVRAQNAQAQAQYQREQQDYRADVQAQHDAYADARGDYNESVSHPHAWWHDRYMHASLRHVYGARRAELIDLRVTREDGTRLGRIRDLRRGSDGRIHLVKIELRDGEMAWVRARDLRYDPVERLVFTDLTASEMYQVARNS